MVPGFLNQLQKGEVETKAKLQKRLNSIFINLFYQAQLLAPSLTSMSEAAFAGSPLGVTPLALSSLLDLPLSCGGK